MLLEVLFTVKVGLAITALCMVCHLSSKDKGQRGTGELIGAMVCTGAFSAALYLMCSQALRVVPFWDVVIIAGIPVLLIGLLLREERQSKQAGPLCPCSCTS